MREYVYVGVVLGGLGWRWEDVKEGDGCMGADDDIRDVLQHGGSNFGHAVYHDTGSHVIRHMREDVYVGVVLGWLLGRVCRKNTTA